MAKLSDRSFAIIMRAASRSGLSGEPAITSAPDLSAVFARKSPAPSLNLGRIAPLSLER